MEFGRLFHMLGELLQGGLSMAKSMEWVKIPPLPMSPDWKNQLRQITANANYIKGGAWSSRSSSVQPAKLTASLPCHLSVEKSAMVPLWQQSCNKSNQRPTMESYYKELA
eukprot:6463681-Amphidinium_carterae.1